MAIQRKLATLIVFCTSFNYLQAQKPEDTKEVKAPLETVYNNPFHSFLLADIMGNISLPTVSKGVPVLGFSPSVAVAPFGISYARLNAQIDFAQGLYTNENTKVLGNYRLDIGFFPIVKKKTKPITFQGSHNGNMYTWQFDVKRNFCFGLVGSYAAGKSFFQTGNDPNTSLYWRNAQNPKGNLVTLPISFEHTSLGIGMITTAWAKNRVTTEQGHKITRRYKAFTHVSLNIVKLNSISHDDSIKLAPQSGFQVLYPVIEKKRNYGLVLRGYFRRKLLSMSVEMGSNPGIEYRFDNGSAPINLNRTYFKISMGIGWM